MAKTLSAKEVLRDFRSGMSDSQLKEKYKLSDKGLLGLFKQMQDAGLIKESDLRNRVPEVSPDAAAPPSQPDERPAARAGFDEKLASAVAQDVRSGLHDNEIMRRHEMAPNALKELFSELARRGYLGEDEIAARLGRKLVTCPHCSSKNPESATLCRQCGKELRVEASQSQPDGMIPPPPLAPPIDTSEAFDYECPWEQRESYGLWNAYFQTAGKCLFNPVELFSRLPPAGGYGNPILFAIFSSALSVPIGMLILTFLGKTGFSLSLIGIVLGFVCALVGAAISTPIALFIWGGLVHGMLLMLQSENRGFQATFRALAYSSAPQLFSAVPLLGTTVAAVYSLVLAVIGLREVHHVSTGKSAAAVGIAAGAIAVLALAFYGLRR